MKSDPTQHAHPGDSRSDGETARHWLAALAPVGPIVAEVAGRAIAPERADRVARLVELLNQHASALNTPKVRKRLTTPLASDILEDAVLHAGRADSEVRLGWIANVVAHATLSTNPKEIDADAEARRMLWLLGQLDENDVWVLRGELAETLDELKHDADFQTAHRTLLNPDPSRLTQDDAGDAVERLGSCHDRLLELGLVREQFKAVSKNSSSSSDPDGRRMRALGLGVTRLGKLLLKYLKLLPSWRRM